MPIQYWHMKTKRPTYIHKEQCNPQMTMGSLEQHWFQKCHGSMPFFLTNDGSHLKVKELLEPT